MILALTFIKIEDLDKEVEAFTEEMPDEVLPFLNWFEDCYIGTVIRNWQRFVRFSSTLQNVHESVLYKEDRTNNHAKVVNRRL